MQGFEADEKGLFTFYREQAEMEEQIKEQRREKARLRKLKNEAEKRKRQEDDERRKMEKLLAQSPTVPVVKVNHFERAKNYIKDLESLGKMPLNSRTGSK